MEEPGSAIRTILDFPLDPPTGYECGRMEGGIIQRQRATIVARVNEERDCRPGRGFLLEP